MGRLPRHRQQLHRVLFLAPTELELAALQGLLATTGAPYTAHCAVVGVGKASAACGATLAIARFKPQTIVLLGCAGALPRSGLKVGDVVVATSERLGDEGVETAAGFFDLERLRLPIARKGQRVYLGDIPVAQLPEASWKALRRPSQRRFTLVRGPLVTVSTCSGTRARAELMARRSGAIAESMEGAAVALAAVLQDRAVLEVRGISNLTGQRRRREWNIPLACRHAAEVALWIRPGEVVPSE